MSSAIENAIARSISQTEIVHIECSAAALAEIKAVADDYVAANDGIVEAWGTDDDGNEWRVHARAEGGAQ